MAPSSSSPHNPECRGLASERSASVWGRLSLWAAATCRQIAAAVTYYYVMPHGKPDFSNVKGPVLGHFGTADELVKRLAAGLCRGVRSREICHRPLGETDAQYLAQQATRAVLSH